MVPPAEMTRSAWAIRDCASIARSGTMNREAVALGTPVYTTFSGRMGAVDERLIAEGRMGHLQDARELPLEGRRSAARAPRVCRDPRRLLDLLLSPLGAGIPPSRRESL